MGDARRPSGAQAPIRPPALRFLSNFRSLTLAPLLHYVGDAGQGYGAQRGSSEPNGPVERDDVDPPERKMTRSVACSHRTQPTS